MTVLPPWLVALQSLVLAACWAYVGRRLLARWMDDPAIKQMRQANGGWYVQTTRHKLLQIGAHLVYAGALSVPLVLAVASCLPQQEQGATNQAEPDEQADPTRERRLARIAADVHVALDARAKSVVDPFANANEGSAHAQQDEGAPHPGVVPERNDTDEAARTDVGQRPVPLVGGEALEFFHGGRAYRLTRLRAKR